LVAINALVVIKAASSRLAGEPEASQKRASGKQAEPVNRQVTGIQITRTTANVASSV
jgi:hypothetical protein